MKTADLRGLAPVIEYADPAAALTQIAAEHRMRQAEYHWIELKSKTLEEFIEALQRLPKNEIRLESSTRVGFHVATKKLVFSRPNVNL